MKQVGDNITVTRGLQELHDADLTQALVGQLLPRLSKHMRSRAHGHCMRVADLDMTLMVALCRALRNQVSDAQVYILGTGGVATTDKELFISSTKLVELRNPLPNGALRPPLMIFLPPNLRASAEDSFGVATFEEIVVTDVYADLEQSLLTSIPSVLQGYVVNLFKEFDTARWPWADPVARIRYLLTAIKNDADAETLGAALFELGLVPDFRLFADPTTLLGRTTRNIECVRKLTDSDQTIRGRVLDLKLSEKALTQRLTGLLMSVGVDTPRRWTRAIVVDRVNWDISFDKWRFEEEIRPDRVTIQSVQTDLPTIGDDVTDERLQGLIGQQVLAPRDRRKVGVVFSVDPHPLQVNGLHHFSVQILSRDGGPVGVSKKVRAWRAARSSGSVTIDKLDRIELEEGWHFIRVLAWTENDDPIPLDLPNTQSYEEPVSAPNESEPFYVLPQDSIGENPPQRAIPVESSLEHARLRLQFTTLGAGRDPLLVQPDRLAWVEKASKTRQASQDVVEVRFGRDGTFQVGVPRVARILEQRILESPRGPISWRLSVIRGEVGTPSPDIEEWPRSSAIESFLGARSRYFAALRSQGSDCISEAADLLALTKVCEEYATTYDDLLADLEYKVEHSIGEDQQRALAALRTILALDTVRVISRDIRGHTREALLLAPTHPMRMLWFTTWAHLGQSWLRAMMARPSDAMSAARDALLQQLVPINYPAMLPLAEGKIYTTVDNLTPFWSLYASATEADPRGLLSELCIALGLPEPAIGGGVLTGEILASRIARYILQHPYVRTLTINAFNPGRAGVLADALVQLQTQDVFVHLRYDIRLFVPDPEAPGVGEALQLMLAPTSSTSSESADAFSTPASSHLFPKLSLAIRSTRAFYEAPSQYRAHLSILLDVFPAEEVGVGPALFPIETASLHGLVQDFVTDYLDADGQVVWRRQPRHGNAHPLEGAEGLVYLLARLPKRISGATATVATGAPAFDLRPLVTLGLSAEQRELIHYAHEVSDWVYTIDRHLGVEFFDHGPNTDRPEYLIDYVSGAAGDFGHQLLITSRSTTELEAMLGPVLERYGLTAVGAPAALMLTQLRSLSGRLALKLISSPTQQAEVLGLALARLFLQQQGALANQLIVPLDAHQDLFRTAKRQAEEHGEGGSLHRTDLCLLDLDSTERIIRCNLVEVKCYTQVGGLGAYNQLKEEITRQIERSEQVLREHFDTQLLVPDRPDRLIKTRELATLLSFYLGRSSRYGLLDNDVAEEGRHLLATLEDGYILRFTRSALIFDFERTGTEPAERENGIEYYRIGVDLIRALVAEMHSTTGAGRETPKAGEHPFEANSVPRLTSAPFIAPKRDRSVTSEQPIIHMQSPTSSPAALYDATHTQVMGSEEASPKAKYPIQASQATTPPKEMLRLPAQADVRDELLVDCHSDMPDPSEQPTLMAARAEGQDPPYDIILGAHRSSSQYGILGEAAGRKVALDLDQTHTISLFGVQGGGKSYTLGSIIEMACLPIPAINRLPNPLATVIFHYSPTLDYKPEFTSVVSPNSDPDQLAQLRTRYGAGSHALEDVVILVPAAKVAERQSEYPNIEVRPIAFAASELKASHWKFLMGAVGSQSLYLRQVNLIMRKLRDALTLEGLVQAIDESALSEHLKDLAHTRLQFAAEYIADQQRITTLIRPGRLIIVDLRDEFIEKDEALGLFVVLLQLFSEATFEGNSFNKLVVFDEAHKYIESPDLIAGLVEVVREMRHKGTSIMVASQDPPSVPIALIELSSEIVLHRFNSPAWLKHIQKANAALGQLSPEKLNQLGSGEAYVWSSRSSDDGFTKGALKIRCRPRVTEHGGETKAATADGKPR